MAFKSESILKVTPCLVFVATSSTCMSEEKKKPSEALSLTLLKVAIFMSKCALLPALFLNFYRGGHTYFKEFFGTKKLCPMAIAGHLVLVDFYSFSFIHSKGLRAAISEHMTSALTTALNVAPVFSVFLNAKCVSPQPTLP